MKITPAYLLVAFLTFETGCKEDPVNVEEVIQVEFDLQDTNGVHKTIFNYGEDIKFYVRMKNAGDENISYTTSDGGPYAEAKVYVSDSLIGSTMDGVIVLPVFSNQTLSPGDTIQYGFYWLKYHQKYHQILQLGNYVATAVSRSISLRNGRGLPFERRIEFTVQ